MELLKDRARRESVLALLVEDFSDISQEAYPKRLGALTDSRPGQRDYRPVSSVGPFPTHHAGDGE